MDEVTQLVEAIRTYINKYPDPNLYLTKDDVWEMASHVLDHTSIPYLEDEEDRNNLVHSALQVVWNEIPGLETRGSWKEIF